MNSTQRDVRTPTVSPTWLAARFRAALDRPHALRRSLLLLVALGAAYAGAIGLLALGGGTPGSAPWLAISREDYFAAETAFTAPVIVLAAVLAAAVTYLVARAFGATGTFDDTMVAIAYATCVATLFSLVPDLFMGAVTTAGLVDGAELAADLVRPSAARIFLWTYLSLYSAAFLVLYPAAVRSAHRVPWWTAVATGWVGFAVYQGVLAVFIR